MISCSKNEKNPTLRAKMEIPERECLSQVSVAISYVRQQTVKIKECH